LIPASNIQAWSTSAPWPQSEQVEQDLIICRALCELFSSPGLAGKIAFRGGTAIHKLLFDRPLRYSEDIDLVQLQDEGIGPTVDAVREALAWLGNVSRDQAAHSMHLLFRFQPEAAPQTTLKLKIEINTREQRSALATRQYPFAVANDWFQGGADIVSFEPEELFGTKLRALLQRNKNRDLFDLHIGLDQLGMDLDRLVECFDHYLALSETPISRAAAEQRMLAKLQRSLIEDVTPLLPAGVTFTGAEALCAFEQVWKDLIVRIQGAPWRLTDQTIGQLRENGFPDLLR